MRKMILTVEDIKIEITYRAIRSLRLKIKHDGDRVLLSLPYGISLEKAETFVRSKLRWIREKRKNLPPTIKTDSLKSGISLRIWGEEYRLLLVKGTRYAFSYSGKTAVLTSPLHSSVKGKQVYLKEQYRAMLEEKIKEKMPLWESQTGLTCRLWLTKDMKTRWGTCNTAAARIWFNVRLAEKPPVCLDYVILHELAHLLYRNHGKEFKAYLTSHLPEWRTVAQLLNQ